MTEEPKDNVFLLPRTVAFYQRELTRMLETERYGEAKALLRFLLQCESGDGQSAKEWRALYDWLLAVSPEPSEEAEPDATEEDLLKAYLQGKANSDPAYVESLLSWFEKPSTPDKQILALEQFRYLEHPLIDDTVKRWLTRRLLPPYIQFKALQTLKVRGATGTVRIRKNGENLTLDLQDTPTRPEEYPPFFAGVYERVQSISLNNDPGLNDFVGQTWQEFFAYLYGTKAYRHLLKEEPAAYDAFAGAFHLMLAEAAAGADEQEIRELYGITNELNGAWERARKLFGAFRASLLPAF